MSKTELTAQEARELAADYREGDLWCGRENRTAAALEQLACAIEKIDSLNRENDDLVERFTRRGGELAAERERVTELERELAAAKADAGRARDMAAGCLAETQMHHDRQKALEAAVRRFASIEYPPLAEPGQWVANTLFCNSQITVADVKAAQAALRASREGAEHGE